MSDEMKIIVHVNGTQYIPAKFDPARETEATADRDSQGPALLNLLHREMDALCAEFVRHGRSTDHELLAAIGSDIVVKWKAIREAMTK